jgi:uncharacterized integral membrane protein
MGPGEQPMLRRFFNVMVLLPLAIVIVAFAVANRHAVTVSLDPVNGADPALSFSLPLFVVILSSAIAGVAIGGSATWFRQQRWRRTARRHEADARAARQALAEGKAGRFVQPLPISNALIRPRV